MLVKKIANFVKPPPKIMLIDLIVIELYCASVLRQANRLHWLMKLLIRSMQKMQIYVKYIELQ